MTYPAADPATDATLLAAARRQPERWARGAGGTTVGEGAIDLASGGSFAVVTEVDLDGTLPLRLVRAYDSDPARPAGVFGPGWCSTFDVRLLVDAGGAALVLPDGALVLFPGWSVFAPFVPDPNDPMSFLDTPVGRAVFYIGYDGRIEKYSSSLSPTECERLFLEGGDAN